MLERAFTAHHDHGHRHVPRFTHRQMTRMSTTRMSTGGGGLAQEGVLKRAIEHRIEAKSVKVDCSDGHNEKWQRGKAAALILEKMLEEPPQFKALVDHERIKHLQYMTQSDVLINRVCGWNGLILKHWVWHALIGIVVSCNCIVIGVEQTYAAEGKDITYCAILEHVFLSFYTVELVMNLTEEGPEGLLWDRWLQLEAVLVLVGVFTSWIITPIFGNLDGLGGIFVVRTVRLLRLARMVRLLQKKELWTLVSGFLSSIGTMTYTSVLLFMVIYGFACVGMEVIRNHSAYDSNLEFQIAVDTYFTSLPRIMLTLVRFIAMDSVAVIYTPIVKADALLIVYFLAVILAVFIVLMNIVTAVIVNTALETNMLDKEHKQLYVSQIRRGITEELGKLFDFFDTDGRGTISLQELLEAPAEACALLCKLTDCNRVEDLFMQIDANGDGELSVDEFCHGLCNIVSSEVPLEIREMQRKLEINFSRVFDILERIESNMDRGFQRISGVEKVVSRFASDVNEDTLKDKEEKMNTGSMRSPPRMYRPPRPDVDVKEQKEMMPVCAPAWVLKLLRELEENVASAAKLAATTRMDATFARQPNRESSTSSSMLSPRLGSPGSKLHSKQSSTLSITEEQSSMPDLDGWRNSTDMAGETTVRKKKKTYRKVVRDATVHDRTKSSLFEFSAPDPVPSSLGQSSWAADSSEENTRDPITEKRPILQDDP